MKQYFEKLITLDNPRLTWITLFEKETKNIINVNYYVDIDFKNISQLDHNKFKHIHGIPEYINIKIKKTTPKDLKQWELIKKLRKL